MKALKKIGVILLILYALLCVALYIVQDKLLFNPSKLDPNYAFRSGIEINIPVDETVELNCLWMKEDRSKGVILYLHGNRGSNRRCWRQAMNIAGNDFDIFMPDYRGYGKSGGFISSEGQLFADVQKVYNHLLTQYDESNIVIVGYSLGSGMASYLAAKNNPAKLILVAPFISFINLKNRRLPIIPNFIVKYPLRNHRYLSQVTCPVTLFHGTRDEIIPYDSSEKLKEINPNNIALVTLQNEGHRGAIFNGLFRRQVSDILKSM